MKERIVDVTDETGARTRVIERISQINTSDLSGRSSVDGLSSFHGPDGETLNADGNGFVGIHSKKRYHRI